MALSWANMFIVCPSDWATKGFHGYGHLNAEHLHDIGMNQRKMYIYRLIYNKEKYKNIINIQIKKYKSMNIKFS